MVQLPRLDRREEVIPVDLPLLAIILYGTACMLAGVLLGYVFRR